MHILSADYTRLLSSVIRGEEHFFMFLLTLEINTNINIIIVIELSLWPLRFEGDLY